MAAMKLTQNEEAIRQQMSNAHEFSFQVIAVNEEDIMYR